MAVYRRAGFDVPLAGEPGECFMCGNEMTDMLVFWHSHLGTIWLHPKCARDLGCHLISDAVKTGEWKD